MAAVPLPPSDEPRPQLMRVKVLFTLHGSSYPTPANTPPLIRMARLSENVYVTPITIHDERGAELVLGEISAKTCLHGVCVAQPELLMDQTKDYSLSILDILETTARKRSRRAKAAQLSLAGSSSNSSPADDIMQVADNSPSPGKMVPETPEQPRGDVFEGKGMMRWVMGERGEGRTRLTGRVVKRLPGEFVDSLELSLRLTERAAMSRGDFVENMRSVANPPATPDGIGKMLGSPSGGDFLSRLFRNETAPTGSPPSRRPATSLVPPTTTATAPNAPPAELMTLLRSLMPNGAPPAPELMPAITSLLQHYVPHAMPPPAATASTSTAEQEKENVAPKRRAPASRSNSRNSVKSQGAIDVDEPAPKRARKSAAATTAAAAAAATTVESADEIVLPTKKTKRCSNCGTTESKVWRTLKNTPRDEIDRYRLCNPCGQFHNKKGEHRPLKVKPGALEPSSNHATPSSPPPAQRPKPKPAVSASNSGVSTSPPRPGTKRRVSLPQVSATSPVRGTKSRSRFGTAIASDGDEELPDLPYGVHRSQLFLAETIPPSSPGLESNPSLPSFVLQASPGTALKRILSGTASDGGDEDVTAMLFSDLSANNTPLSEAWQEGTTIGGSKTSAIDFDALFSDHHPSSSKAPHPSSSGLTEAALGMHLEKPLPSPAMIFGSPSRWAMLNSPLKEGQLGGEMPEQDSEAMTSFLAMLKSSPPRPSTSRAGEAIPPTSEPMDWYSEFFGGVAGTSSSAAAERANAMMVPSTP